MNNKDRTDTEGLPDSTWVDHAYTAAKAAASLIPGGGTAAELIGIWVKQPLEKRRQAWFEAIVERLHSLETKNAEFNAENAFRNEAFVTAFVEATLLAVRTHQEEKREALLNGVSSAALPDAPDENKVLLFLDFIGSFGKWHFRILEFCNDPIRYAAKYAEMSLAEATSIMNVIEKGAKLQRPMRLLYHIHPELRGQTGLVEMVLSDLSSRGLGGGDWPEPAAFFPPTDEFAGHMSFYVHGAGIEFLEFISSPT